MVNQRCGDGNNGVNDHFDLEAAIANLLSDDGSRSLELPSNLTPEQRNQGKLIAGQFPELKCESYGFGADRRLHIFKKNATTCVRVRNTFVEGWAAFDDEENESNAIIFRSEPGNLWERAALYSARHHRGGKLELPPLCKRPSRPVTPEMRPEPVQKIEDPDTEYYEIVLPGGEKLGVDLDIDSLQVWNIGVSGMIPTWNMEHPQTQVEEGDVIIEVNHIKNNIEAVVGEIRKSSEMKLSLQHHKFVKEVPALPLHPAVPPGRFDTFSIGAMVVIQGLVRAPAFNGRVGVVHSLDSETGRYDVLLACPSSAVESKPQWTKVKYENLRLAAPSQQTSSAAAA